MDGNMANVYKTSKVINTRLTIFRVFTGCYLNILMVEPHSRNTLWKVLEAMWRTWEQQSTLLIELSTLTNFWLEVVQHAQAM